MAAPSYRIYYGKYPDVTPNEIPNSHIKSLEGLKFSIEPGKPAEPKVDSARFTLENLATDGSERYDDSWFEAHSRSEAEGGTFPNQLFFKIELDTGASFYGVFKGKSYGKYRAQVQVEVKSLLELVSDNKLTMLKSIEFDTEYIDTIRSCDDDPTPSDFPCGIDLNADPIKHQYVSAVIENTIYKQPDDPGYEYDNLLYYLFGFHDVPEPAPGTSKVVETPYFNAYLKINDNTILTTVKFRAEKTIEPENAGPQLVSGNTLIISFYNAANGNVEDGERTILERGRFFSDDQGTHLTETDNPSMTLIGPDRGFNGKVMVKEADFPATQFMFGCPVEVVNNQLEIKESAMSVDVFNLAETTMQVISTRLFGQYYKDAPENLDLSKINTLSLKAFWADVGMFGWADQSVSETMVNMSLMSESYLFMNENGEIVLQGRNLHENDLPASLPPGAFEVDLADIRPLGAQAEGNGFDSFTITYRDRIEINNVESDAKKEVAVDAEGLRSKPALRNTDLKVEAYRTKNLGVPATQNGLPLFRRSPDDSSFGINGVDLDDFLPTAPVQAQNFAKSWSYPTELWKIEWDMNRYPQAGIGGYFWVQWPGAKRVYFIRQITHDPDTLTHKMEVQNVGTYNG